MDKYEVLGDINVGAFGRVQKILRKEDKRVLVWKELDYGRMSDREKQQCISEVSIIKELRHPHIVKYYDRIIDRQRQKIYIVQEFCEGGDLAEIIKRCKKTNDYIAEDVIWKILMQIIMALYECHRRKEGKVLHRDLKPGNIFLDANKNVKLGDFGLSRVMGIESCATSNVGTPYYMSPEQINESKYNEKSDIWSAGCILYEMAALHPPFQAKNPLSLAIKIKEGNISRLPERYSEELQRVTARMLSVDQTKRPDVEDLLNLPQISLRRRERKLRENLTILKRKEEELRKREMLLREREEAATLRLREVEERE